MPTPGDPEQTWIIEQFLRGNLPRNAHRQIEERMAADSVFEKQVMAQWLVLNYLDEQKLATTFYQEIDPVIIAAGKRKTMYDTHSGIRYLTQLIGIAAAVLIFLGTGFLTYRYNQPLNRQVSTVPVHIDDSEEYGFSDGEDSVVVIQYDRLPGFWAFGNKYTWKTDTLALYGPLLGQAPIINWRIAPTNRRNMYLLSTEKGTYSLLRGQMTLTPLEPNEKK